jgi:hypothetical protein
MIKLANNLNALLEKRSNSAAYAAKDNTTNAIEAALESANDASLPGYMLSGGALGGLGGAGVGALAGALTEALRKKKEKDYLKSILIGSGIGGLAGAGIGAGAGYYKHKKTDEIINNIANAIAAGRKPSLSTYAEPVDLGPLVNPPKPSGGTFNPSDYNLPGTVIPRS